MNRYRVTTEITIEVRAFDEDEARDRAEEHLQSYYNRNIDLSGYYEVEEVLD